MLPVQALPGSHLTRLAGDRSWPGTPEQILGEAPHSDHPGASMLHLGCHGKVIGSARGRSHLVLADLEELRVDAILGQARDGTAPSARRAAW